MGQRHPGFVVQLADNRLGKFEAIPQKDPDESPSPEWRITVNPSADFFGSARLKSLIDRLYHHQKLMTPTDGRQVLTALQALDPSADILLPLLTVLSNATAYPANQLIMKDIGITDRIVSMMTQVKAQYTQPCRLMLLQCVANMAVATENNDVVRKGIPYAIGRLTSQDETEVTIALQALTNMSLRISTDEIPLFSPAISSCLSHLWVRGEVNINALRLLVNLSCCPDLVPFILGSKPVSGLLRILDSDRDEILLRAVTWLLCISSAVEALMLTYDRIAVHNQDPFRNPMHTLYYCIYGPKGREEMVIRANELTEHKQKDIAYKSARLLEIVHKVPPFPTPALSLNKL